MKEASEYCGLHPNTLRKYIDLGRIHGSRIGTHRFIESSELDKLLGVAKEKTIGVAIYSRVSTHKQKEDGNLDRQTQRLQSYCTMNNIPIVESISEVASGVNERRKGLSRLIELATTGKIDAVVIEYKDRLARFGFEYIKKIFDMSGVKIIIIDSEEKVPQAELELVEDLTAIVSSFSAKLYGKRGAKNIVSAIKAESNAS